MVPDLSISYYKSILREKKEVSLEHAVFRNTESFVTANLNKHFKFWEQEILKDHPQKTTLLKWISGVRIEDFLNSFTSSEYQGIRLHSFYPPQMSFPNYVPIQFEDFMNNNIQEWITLGVLQKWEQAKLPSDPLVPVVVCPLGVEPKKPRGLWDGRFVNEFCRDIPFSMDNTAKVAELAWSQAYFFKLDHKNGYFHVPIHELSRKYFGVFWKGCYYVLTVLPFGWKSSPYIYHTLTEAVNMYIRSLGIPMLGWIDDMLGMNEQSSCDMEDEQQFQSAMRSMVVVTIILFKAGYFLGTPKCYLIPEKVMTYLGIECNSISSRFFVPEERVLKYIPLLNDFIHKQWVSFSDLERIVGKLVSLESAVPAGMWYTREQYAALRLSGIPPTATKTARDNKYIKVTPQLVEEWTAWIYFLQQNSGSPWKKFQNIFIEADITSDASGRCYAGKVDFPEGPTKITAGEFEEEILLQDIQVKEGEALRATLHMLVTECSDQIKGKTLICKIDNQVLKAVLERKGTSQNLALNTIGKHIYWLQQHGGFHIALEYVKSADNTADKFTRESPGLEASLNQLTFNTLWEKWGPFEWDLMATAANVNKDPQGNKLKFFSRYYDSQAKGTNLFAQQLRFTQKAYCFPPFPIIGMVIKFLEQHKLECVLVLPAINATWVNLVSAYMTDLITLSKPFSTKCFTILNGTGVRVPKKYPFAMIAVKMNFNKKCSVLAHLHA